MAGVTVHPSAGSREGSLGGEGRETPAFTASAIPPPARVEYRVARRLDGPNTVVPGEYPQCATVRRELAIPEHGPNEVPLVRGG